MRRALVVLASMLLLSGCAQLGLGNGAVELDETRRTWCYDHPEAIAREWTDDDDVVVRAAIYEWPIEPTAAPYSRRNLPFLDVATAMIFWGSDSLGGSRSDLDEASARFREAAPSAYSLACQRAWDHR